jgi:hypothetical protein
MKVLIANVPSFRNGGMLLGPYNKANETTRFGNSSRVSPQSFSCLFSNLSSKIDDSQDKLI